MFKELINELPNLLESRIVPEVTNILTDEIETEEKILMLEDIMNELEIMIDIIDYFNNKIKSRVDLMGGGKKQISKE